MRKSNTMTASGCEPDSRQERITKRNTDGGGKKTGNVSCATNQDAEENFPLSKTLVFSSQ